MKVKELIELLHKFDDEHEIVITDCSNYTTYQGTFRVLPCTVDGNMLVDIDVTGLRSGLK